MKSLFEIEKSIENDLKIRTVSDIQELSDFNDYSEIIQLHKRKEITFGFLYQENVIDNFGSNGEAILNRILLSSPILITILSIIFSITKSDFILLIGIPLALVGMFLTTPNIMKQGSGFLGVIMLGTLTLGIYYCFKDFKIAFLLLSYSVPNFLLTVNRQLNRDVFQEIILKSEIIFIYYFIRGEFFTKDKTTGIIYGAKR